MVRQFNYDMKARVQNDKANGCAMARTLFADAFQDRDAVFPVSYCVEGKLFNLRLQARYEGVDRCTW